MANEADKRRAQRLVDEANKQYSLAKSKHEKRQWAVAHLPLLEQATKLDLNNDATWSNLGIAKSELGDHQGAIDDLTEAIDLNPENDAARQNLEAAEIALASHKNAEKPQQEKEKYHTRLKERAKSHKKEFNILNKQRMCLFLIIIIIIFTFIILFARFFYCYVYGGSDSPLRQAIGELNFFTLWPYFMLMFVCLSPFL